MTDLLTYQYFFVQCTEGIVKFEVWCVQCFVWTVQCSGGKCVMFSVQYAIFSVQNGLIMLSRLISHNTTTLQILLSSSKPKKKHDPALSGLMQGTAATVFHTNYKSQNISTNRQNPPSYDLPLSLPYFHILSDCGVLKTCLLKSVIMSKLQIASSNCLGLQHFTVFFF